MADYETNEDGFQEVGNGVLDVLEEYSKKRGFSEEEMFQFNMHLLLGLTKSLMDIFEVPTDTVVSFGDDKTVIALNYLSAEEYEDIEAQVLEYVHGIHDDKLESDVKSKETVDSILANMKIEGKGH